MSLRPRLPSRLRALALAAVLAAALGMVGGAGGILIIGAGRARAADPLRHLRSELGTQQARQGTLSGSISALDTTIGSLGRQIALLQGRETTVRDALASEQVALRRVRGQLSSERAHLAVLRARLAGARRLLAVQLRSGYESPRPTLVSVVLSAHGFDDLLDQLSFLGRAENEQQRLIAFTASAKHQADTVASRLAALRVRDARIEHGSVLEARALSGMNLLLDSRERALARARVAQTAALDASRAVSRRLSSRIASVQAAQRAAALRAARIRAARAAAVAQAAAAATTVTPTPTTGPPTTTPPTGASGATDGWAIPYSIVLCESGGQNLPPNSAGASGYYQIIPGTWRLFGGTGPAAWLASEAEQSAVATKIWNGGAGASNWVCAGIVGIH
jgi:septal ring factor EnvC (AmiA/AmiB activator)